MRHHAIVVTSYEREALELAHETASDIFGGAVSAIVDSPINGYASFFVPPDGSKEGWEVSNDGNCYRDRLIAWLEPLRGLDWVEVQYGDDGHVTMVCRDSDSGMRETSPAP